MVRSPSRLFYTVIHNKGLLLLLILALLPLPLYAAESTCNGEREAQEEQEKEKSAQAPAKAKCAYCTKVIKGKPYQGYRPRISYWYKEVPDQAAYFCNKACQNRLINLYTFAYIEAHRF